MQSCPSRAPETTSPLVCHCPILETNHGRVKSLHECIPPWSDSMLTFHRSVMGHPVSQREKPWHNGVFVSVAWTRSSPAWRSSFRSPCPVWTLHLGDRAHETSDFTAPMGSSDVRPIGSERMKRAAGQSRTPRTLSLFRNCRNCSRHSIHCTYQQYGIKCK